MPNLLFLHVAHLHGLTLLFRSNRDGLEFLCQNATHRFAMKPHSETSRLIVLTAALVAGSLSAPTYAAAQELEVKQPDSTELIGAAGVELPFANSFEELDARQQPRQLTATSQAEPVQADRTTAARVPATAPKPSAKPVLPRKQKSAIAKSTKRKSVALAPLPKAKPKIIPIEEVLQAGAAEDEPPLVEVVDSFSPRKSHEFDDSSRR